MRLIPAEAKPPDMLYKYGGPGALEILRTRSIYLTRPEQFNDPFDTKPRFGTTASVRAAAVALPEEGGGSAESLLRIKNVVILSLTPHRDSLLMWAHYAEAHRGLTIGFDGQSDILAGSSPHRAAGPVVYTRTRPSAPTHGELTDPKVLLTKGLDWSYEDEWRIIDSHHSAGADEPDETGERWPFDLQSAAVKEVILGFRCGRELEEAAAAVLREPDYQHVRLYTACPSATEYHMDINEWPRPQWCAAAR
jgi:hypothetical protein